MTKSYWNGNGRYEELNTKLEAMVPNSGEVDNPEENPKLERFRKASNAYRDLFHNGGRTPERRVSYYFPKTLTILDRPNDSPWEKVYEVTEPIMDKIILLTAVEQGLITRTDLKNIGEK